MLVSATENQEELHRDGPHKSLIHWTKLTVGFGSYSTLSWYTKWGNLNLFLYALFIFVYFFEITGAKQFKKVQMYLFMIPSLDFFLFRILVT